VFRQLPSEIAVTDAELERLIGGNTSLPEQSETDLGKPREPLRRGLFEAPLSTENKDGATERRHGTQMPAEPLSGSITSHATAFTLIAPLPTVLARLTMSSDIPYPERTHPWNGFPS
jgi:hypothetical protein